MTSASVQGAGVESSRWRRFVSVVRHLPATVLLGVLRGYQLLISPMLPQSCKYYPSCSQYAVVAIRRHGVLTGVRLATWRLLRCNPWSHGGVDDVPAVRPHRSHTHR